MSLFFTDTARQIEEALSGKSGLRLQGSCVCGNVLMARGTWIQEASAKAGDQIRVTRLPKGAVLIPTLCSLTHEVLGERFALDLGLSDKPACYAQKLSLSQEGSQALSSSTSPFVLEKTDWLTATLTDISQGKPQSKLSFWIAYIQP